MPQTCVAPASRAAREAGATHLWMNVLNLRPGTREHFLEELARDWPEELERYERLYAGRAYLRGSDTAELRLEIDELRRGYDIADRRIKPLAPPPEPTQLALAL